MNITIELGEFWTDGENLDEELRRRVTREVTKAIWEKIEDKVEREVTDRVKATVEEMMTDAIQKKINMIIATEKVPAPSRSNFDEPEITLERYIAYQFKNQTGFRSPKEAIEKIAKKTTEELKNRYDLMFASQVVAKMNDQGMLREDVAKLLLDDNGKNS